LSDWLRADALSVRLKRFVFDLDRKQLFVAYSGGVDSTVLLHALWRLREQFDLELVALHADHQLQKISGEWHLHCQAFCSDLGIPFRGRKFTIKDIHREGMEAAARNARYAWFLSQTGGATLVTGHNQEDQAETVLLRLVRGSGGDGLAAISPESELGGSHIARPLLGESRGDITAYAKCYNLLFVEDDTNCDISFDRNYIRHQILPLFRARWPAVDKTIARAAGHLKRQRIVRNKIARADLRACYSDTAACILGDFGRLRLDQLVELGTVRMADVLRYWIRRHGMEVPNTRRLMELIRQIRSGGASRKAAIRWRDGEIRAYRSDLYLIPVQPDPCFRGIRAWLPEKPIDIDAAGIRLRSMRRQGRGLRIPVRGVTRLALDWRAKAEMIQPAGSAHRHSVKKLFQQAGIPPWERVRIPKLYLGEKLVCIPGLVVDRQFAAQGADMGLEILIDPLIAPGSDPNHEISVVQRCGVW
jgi:tRNA(Ile)-lysidine synthase